jgi:hypothetical protein
MAQRYCMVHIWSHYCGLTSRAAILVVRFPQLFLK